MPTTTLPTTDRETFAQVIEQAGYCERYRTRLLGTFDRLAIENRVELCHLHFCFTWVGGTMPLNFLERF